MPDRNELVLVGVVREGHVTFPDDKRRRVNSVLAEYRDCDGFIYRKSFFAPACEKVEVPLCGTHKSLYALRRQGKLGE